MISGWCTGTFLTICLWTSNIIERKRAWVTLFVDAKKSDLRKTIAIWYNIKRLTLEDFLNKVMYKVQSIIIGWFVQNQGYEKNSGSFLSCSFLY